MRVVIAEDSAVLREGLIHLLATRGHQTVAAVGDAEQLHRAVRTHHPDIALVDVRMPPDHTDEGLRATRALRHANRHQAILVFSQHVERRWVTELLADGADGLGYLLKDRAADVGDFLDAVERVAAGGTALDPDVVAHLLGRRGTALARLTEREHQVLALMAQGRSNAGIAQTLVLSAGAIEKNVAAIFTKLDLPSGRVDNRRVLAILHYLQS